MIEYLRLRELLLHLSKFQSVLIGEPGLGKSGLVYTLKQYVLGQRDGGGGGHARHRVALLAALPKHGVVPSHRLYERAFGFGRDEGPQDRFDRLIRHLERYDLTRPETRTNAATEPKVAVRALPRVLGLICREFRRSVEKTDSR